MEIENRIKLKEKYLNDEKDLINNDHKLLLVRIDTTSKQEENFYKAAIRQIEKQENDILKKSISQEEKEIKKLEKDLAQIEAEDGETDSSAITSRLQELIDVVTVNSEETSKIIRLKSAIMEENIALVNTRRQRDKDDAKVLIDRELRNIDYAIELLEQNKEAELHETKARYAKTLNVYNDLKADVSRQITQKKEEHVGFKKRREDYEKDI